VDDDNNDQTPVTLKFRTGNIRWSEVVYRLVFEAEELTEFKNRLTLCSTR
jgi:hypothetical protein